MLEAIGALVVGAFLAGLVLTVVLAWLGREK